MDRSTAESLLSFAEEAAPTVRSPDSRAAIDEIEARSAGILAAIEWFADAGRPDEALRLAIALYPYWIQKQLFSAGAVAFDRALSSPGGDKRLRAQASISAGFMPFWLGDDDGATAHFRRGLHLSRELDDPRLIERALGGLARVAFRSDVAEGRRLAHEALLVSEAAADEIARSDALHLLGVGAQMAGDLPEAQKWMTLRLALVREQGNAALISSEAANLSMVERQLGNLDRAEALIREALEIADRRGDEFMKPFALSGFAAIAMDQGRYGRSARLVGAAEAMMEAQAAAWPPDERPQYERLLTRLPAAMGSEAFEQARAAGHAMPTPDAVAFALDGSAARFSTP